MKIIEKAATLLSRPNDKKLSKRENFEENRSLRKLLKQILLSSNGKKLKPLLKGYIDTQLIIKCAEILWVMGQIPLAIKLFHKGLTKARKYSFVNLAYQSLKKLVTYYSYISHDHQKLKHYKKIFNLYQGYKLAEENAELIYCNLQANFIQKLTTPEFLESQTKELSRLRNNSNELNFKRFYYYGLMLIYDHQNHPNLKQTCEEAIEYFESLKLPVPSNYIFFCYYNLLPRLIKNGDYGNASKYLEQCQYLAVSSHINKAVTTFYAIINAIHAEDYELAYQLHLSRQQIKSQYRKLQELFLLLEGYLEFLRLCDLLQYERQKQFRLTTFFNNLEKLSKDKKEMNVNIRILRVLLLLGQEKRDMIEEESEALRIYTIGLKKMPNIDRARYMLYLLGNFQKSNFNPIAFTRHSERWMNKLEAMPLQSTTMSVELEVIPFGRVYELVLGLLK